MARKDYIDKINKNMEKLTKDELKDVATLTNVQFGVRLKVAEKEYWEKEVEAIKSKLQQQALPVVPECVDKWYKFHMNGTFSAVITAYAVDGADKPVIWLVQNGGMDLLCKMKLYGYTVEKPQLFYLKHIDMSKRNSINDLYLKKYIHADLTENGEHRLSHAMSAKGIYPSKEYCAFTQQEIDSMETGSYEQIEVTE